MKSLISQIQRSDFYFTLIFFAAVAAPVIGKLLLMGQLGPQFNFYFFVLWLPFVTILATSLRGWRDATISGALFVAALILALVTYPPEPFMDFQRQFTNKADGYIVTAAIASICLSIFFHRRRMGSLVSTKST